MHRICLSLSEQFCGALIRNVAAMCPRYCILLGINELYFKTGVKPFIPMHRVAEEIGHEMSLILSVIHVLSGCDSASSASGS